jgi:hypothetical protein
MIIDKIVIIVSSMLLNSCVAIGYIVSAGSVVKTEIKFMELEEKIISIKENKGNAWRDDVWKDDVWKD